MPDCQAEKKDPRNRRLSKRLVQCLTFEAGVSLLNAAKIIGDQRVLLEVEGCDMIAKKYYTRSLALDCLRIRSWEK